MIAWIKQHKILTCIIAVILFYTLRIIPLMSMGSVAKSGPMMIPPPYALEEKVANSSVGSLGQSELSRGVQPPIQDSYAPQHNVPNRMVTKDSDLSLLTKNVAQTIQTFTTYTEGIGGYMVNSSVTNPNDNGNGQVIYRVPTSKLDDALAYYRSYAIKVVSENIHGSDITDQYMDIQARLDILQKNKATFETIMSKTTTVADIMNVQQQIMNLQNQIDSLQGQKQYLDKISQMSKVVIYLSTDEIALPYTPDEPWQPAAIFKQAVRSLVAHLRMIVTTIIWIIVYGVVFLPVLLIALFAQKVWQRKHPKT